MRKLVIISVIALSGCANTPKVISNANVVERKASVIYVGMPFDVADKTLSKFGAKPSGAAILLSEKDTRNGLELHWYYLGSGVTMSLVSKKTKDRCLVYSIAVSTYKPKSWNSKMDPEYDKFYNTFRGVAEIDLEVEPNQSTSPMRTSGAHD